IGEVTHNRAKLIAQDQTNKITSRMNFERMRSVGVKEFMWIHSSASANPRPKHVRADGNVYPIDDPPNVGDHGQPVIPGEEINCRCRMKPVVDFSQYLK